MAFNHDEEDNGIPEFSENGDGHEHECDHEHEGLPIRVIWSFELLTTLLGNDKGTDVSPVADEQLVERAVRLSDALWDRLNVEGEEE